MLKCSVLSPFYQELALLAQVPVNVNGGSGGQQVSGWEAHEYWKKYGWKTREEYLNYLWHLKQTGITGHYDFSTNSTFDFMALSEAFLSEYYATVSTFLTENRTKRRHHVMYLLISQGQK